MSLDSCHCLKLIKVLLIALLKVFRYSSKNKSVNRVLKSKQMAKLHVLKYSQWLMSKLGIYPYRLTDPPNEFFKSILTYYIFFVSICLTVCCSVAFMNVHWPDFERISCSFMIACSGIQTAGMFFCFGLQLKNVKSVHLKLQEIVDAKGTSDTFFSIKFIFKKFKI